MLFEKSEINDFIENLRIKNGELNNEVEELIIKLENSINRRNVYFIGGIASSFGSVYIGGENMFSDELEFNGILGITMLVGGSLLMAISEFSDQQDDVKNIVSKYNSVY